MLKYIFYIKNKFFKFSKNYLNIKKNLYFKNIIISHLVNYENISFNNDFYFGNLGRKIDKKKTLIVLIDHIKLKKNKIKKKLIGNYIVLSQNLGFIKEIDIHTACLFRIITKEKIKFNLSNYLNLVASKRVFEQIKKVLSLYNPKNLIFTFEGNLYEGFIVN